ncbi:MAG: DNA-3-methyladenine glycosylase [Synechococcus sp.]
MSRLKGHYSVNVVTHHDHWANGVLLRTIALLGETDRVAAGPGLVAKRYGIDRRHVGCSACGENAMWLASRPADLEHLALVTTTRIGISQGQALPWRWYLQRSRSVSQRARGDRMPSRLTCWSPEDVTA